MPYLDLWKERIVEPGMGYILALEGIYSALSLAVQDPVLIPNQDYDHRRDSKLPLDTSRVYFYVEDERGRQIVQRRIDRSGEDICMAYRLHRTIEREFQTILDAGKSRDRRGIKQHTSSLCDILLSYRDFVRAHIEHQMKGAFIQYPSFLSKRFAYYQTTKVEAERKNLEDSVVMVDFDETISENVAIIGPVNATQSYKEFTKEVVTLLGHAYRKGVLLLSEHIGSFASSYKESIDLMQMLMKEHFRFDVNK